MLEDDLRMTLKPLQWVVDLETAMFHEPPSRVVAAGRHFWEELPSGYDYHSHGKWPIEIDEFPSCKPPFIMDSPWLC